MRSSCYDRSPGKSRCNPCIIDIPFIGICERLAKILSELCRVKIQARLITEVLRGTYRHQKIKALRSASERTNATAKSDFSILDKPKIRGLKHAAILSQMTAIVVLLKRIARFIIKVTLALRRKLLSNRTHRNFIPGPNVPNFISNLIHRE